jgi:hypothetical protein
VAKKQTRRQRRNPSKGGRPVKLDNKRTRDAFFKHLRRTGSRGRACTLAGIKSYQTLLNYMQLHEDFSAEVVEVENQALDELEESAHKTQKRTVRWPCESLNASDTRHGAKSSRSITPARSD